MILLNRRVLATLLALLSFVPLTSCTRKDSHLQKPVLQVNAKVLTAKEFGDQLAKRLRSNDAISAKDPENIARAKDSILREFIVQSLLVEWAEKNSIKPSKASVDEELEKVRAGYPDDLALKRMLSQENVSPQEWRQQIEMRLLRELVMEKLREEIPQPTEEEQKEYFKTHSEMFVLPKAVQLQQVVTAKENDAERILEAIKGGKNIEELAREFSTAPERAEGGLTDWIEEGVLEVFDKAFDMRVGEISGILESPFGYHIYKVLAKRSEKKLTFQEAQPRVIQILLLEREQHRYKAWLENQIRRARVFKDEKLLESIKVETRR
jgi:peptidyl-prolyl cis-trans isomerase C